MVAKWRLLHLKQKFWFSVPVIAAGALIYFGNTVVAQVTPDQTLEKENSVVTPVDPNVDRIDGGAVRGSNLFHSFKDFNVGGRRRVDFANPAGVENIFSRVTGGNRSEILGTLGVLGNANLFLLNPNGIIFGSNAQLDIRGSFVGTTAESIKFADESFFSASNPQEVPLLKISIPIGLQIPQNPGKITIKGDGHNLTYEVEKSTFATIQDDVPGLQTPTGKILALVGGDIALEGGNLRAESGRIELGSVASPGLVNIIQNNSGFTFGYSGIEDFGNIQLSQKASVDASGDGGGSIQVQSKRLSLKDGSSILSITSGTKPGGNFTVNATESVELIGESVDGNYASSLLTESQGAGTSGNLTVNTGKLTTTDGAYLSTFITSSGNGGNLTVKASDSIELLGRGENTFESGLYTGASSGSSGNAGELKVETGNLTVKDNATVFANSSGLGDSGDIFIQAFDRVAVSNARIVSSAINAQQASAGDITVNTDSLFLTNGGNISSDILFDENFAGEGYGGNITINARDQVNLDGISNINFQPKRSGITTVLSRGKGRSGNIEVNTGKLSVINGAELSTFSFGTGNAGNITINAKDTITFDGFGIDGKDDFLLPSSANSFYFGDTVGNGGDISVTGKALFLTNGGLFNANNIAQGNGGNIYLDIHDKVTIDGVSSNGITTGLPSNLSTLANTNAGNIEIKTGTLKVINGGYLMSFAGENGGDITVNARDEIIFGGINSERQSISSGVLSSLLRGKGKGKAGDIKLTSKSLTLANGAVLDSKTYGKGDAGNILINVQDKVTLDGVGSNGRSSIISTVQNQAIGDGGNVEITTNSLSVTNGAQINNSTFGEGNAGDIKINARGTTNLKGVSSDGRASGIFSIVGKGGTGRGGNLDINSGNLDLTYALISARTTSGDGGNIKLNIQDVLSMSRGSQITTNAGTAQQGGNGGNIDIKSKFIITVPNENSDITANAFEGQGGKINIASEKIFWMEQRDRKKLIELLDSSSQLNPNLLSTNDITAFSQQNPNLDDSVTINLFNTIDPSRGLTSLPTAFVDPSELIDQSCTLSSSKSSSQFVNTGSGGLPTNPSNPLSPNNTIKRLATPIARRSHIAQRSQTAQRMQTSSSSSTIPLPDRQEPESIVEAQGWVRLGNGKIRLVAQAPSITPQGNWQTMSSCYVH